MEINLGMDFNEWDIDIENISYNTMADEVTNKFNIHKYESISIECYNKIKKECQNIYKLQYNNNNTNEFIYTINELISLKIYTDLTDYQYAFRRVFWESNKHKRQYFYNFARQFILTFNYGAIPQFNRMFHGLSKIFKNNEINDVVFYGPISLSLIKNQADNFAKTHGIIWEVK